MAGYSRQSAADIIANAIIKAAPVNAEYNALRDAFALATGHKHDGSSTEGGYVPLIADSDALNKVVIDTSNNRIGFFSEVSSAAVEQIRIQDGAIVPVTDNDIDLGGSSTKFKNLYVNGIASIGSISLSGGTIDNTVIGGSTASSGSFTTIAASSNATVGGTLGVTGNVTMGGTLAVTGTTSLTGTATITSADINSGAMDNTTIGNTTAAAGTFTDLTSTGTSTHATVDINGGAIDGVTIGAASAGAGTFTDLTASGTTTVTTADINGGNIDGTIIGASSAAAGSFTTVSTTGQATLATVDINGGAIDGAIIGANSAAAITGTTITASSGFVGDLTGNITGDIDGDITGNITGNVTGNVTANSGTSTFANVTVNGTLDVTGTTIANVTDPSSAQDAATKNYVDTQVSGLVDSAPGTLNTLNELAAALGDDASFSTTITNSIATKLPLAGGTMSGAIAMGTSKITGLGDPTADQDAATKKYTTDTFLPLAGGTLTGAVAAGSNKITATYTPSANSDLTTKTYVDGILGSGTSAASSATAAASSATAAASSATAAASSATGAASSATSAAASFDSFDDRYLGAKSSAPSTDNDGDALQVGTLYFNTTTNSMQVYGGSGFTAAGSSVNGTSSRNTYTATAGQTSFAATYDSGFVDVYLNGVKLLAGTDFTATNGTSVVLASGAAVNDIVDIVAYGTFTLSTHYTKTEADALLAAKQPYATIAVTVVNSGGNKYALDGTVQQLAQLRPSVTYRFDQSDSSNAGHPLLLSTTSNGTHGGGSAFTTGVTAVGTPGSAGAYTEVKLEQDAPNTLYYYCTNHSGMGGEIDVNAKLPLSGGTLTGGLTGTTATFTTADNSDNLTLVSTDADASSGPNLKMYRNSSSPADVDEMGNILFVGRNDNSQDVTYGEIEVYAMDVSDGSEDGLLNINTVVGGTGTSRIKAITSETVINDDSADIDFRVESNGNANMLFVDGGNNAVVIGHNNIVNVATISPSLQIEGTGFASSAVGQYRYSDDAFGPSILFASSRNSSIAGQTILQSGDELGKFRFYGSDGNDFENYGAEIIAAVDGTPGSNDMPGRLVFSTTADGGTTATERLRITSDGSVGINDSSPDGKLNVVSNAHNNGSIFDSTGTTQLWLRDTDAASNQKNWGFQVSGGDLNIVRANDDRASGFVTPIYIQQAPANSLVIDSSGNVGVNCTPNNYSANHRSITLNGPATPIIDLEVNSTRTGSIVAESTKFDINAVTSVPIRLLTADTERFRIGTAGQLGIGGATYGTSGQVLTSGGSGAAPTWADAGGGAYELVSRSTISSNTSEVVFSGLSTSVGVLKLVINNLKFSSDCNLYFNFRDSSNNNLSGGTAYTQASHYFTSGNADGDAGASVPQIYLNLSYQINDGAGGWERRGFSGVFYIFDFGNDYPKVLGESWWNGEPNYSNFYRENMGAMYTLNTTAAAGFRIWPSGGNITSGNISLLKLT